MHCRILPGLMSIFLVGGSTAFADDVSHSVDPSEGWKLAVETKDVAIYSRSHADSRLKEFRAIGPIDAPACAVHAVIDDLENYPSFMPYTLECRLLKREADSIITYQRLSPKICQDRDYTLRVWKKSWAGPGGLIYLNRWEPANDLGPAEKKGVVRVKICDGGWLLEPNRASQTGISSLFAAIRKQVKDPKYALRAGL